MQKDTFRRGTSIFLMLSILWGAASFTFPETTLSKQPGSFGYSYSPFDWFRNSNQVRQAAQSNKVDTHAIALSQNVNPVSGSSPILINNTGSMVQNNKPFAESFKGTRYKYFLPEGTKGEYINRRTQNSKVLLKNNGNLVELISATSLHYQDQNGKWQDIDNTLKATSDSGFDYQNSANRFNTLFTKSTDKGNFIRFRFDNTWLDFKPIGANTTSPIFNVNEIVYPNIYNGVNFKYLIGSDSLKEDIILNSYNGKNSFSFELGKKDLTYSLDQSGNIQFFDSTGKKLWTMAKPYMVDAKGIQSTDVQFNLSTVNGKKVLTISANAGWLSAKDRSYPVTIDPSIIMSDGIQSTFIEGDNQGFYNNQKFYQDPRLVVGKQTENISGFVTNETFASLINFNVMKKLQPGSTILSAKVRLYGFNMTGNQGTPLIDAIGSSWSPENTTYANSPSLSTGNPIPCSGIEDNWYTYDVTQFAKKWASGTSPEYGLSLTPNTGTGTYEFMSERYGINSPQIEVEFENPYYAGYSADVPTVMLTGQTMQVPVNVTNSGTKKWVSTGTNPVRLSYHWVNMDGSTNIWDGGRCNLPYDFNPGDAGRLLLNITAPAKPGKYKLQIDMVEESVTWFSGKKVPTADVNVTVIDNMSGLGIERFWQYQTDEFKNKINVDNGNLVLQKELFNLPGRLPIISNITYNSLSNFNGVFGYGWNSEIDRSISEETNGNVKYIDEDGTEHIFTKTINGDFSAPQGIYLYLEKLGDGTYKLTDTQTGSFNIFAKHKSAFKISSFQDANKNKILFNYNNDRIESLQLENDNSKRKITLEYDGNNRITTITMPGPNQGGTVKTQLTYDNENLVKVEEAFGTSEQRTTTYEYSGHDLTKIIYPNGRQANYVYDANNRIASIKGTNMVYNSGFDKPVNPFDGWTCTAPTGATVCPDSDAYSGSKSAKLTKTLSTPETDIISSDIDVSTDTDYTFSFAGKVSTVNNIQGHIGVIVKGFNSKWQPVLEKYVYIDKTDWTRYSFAFNSKSATHIRIFGVMDPDAQGSMWLDNFQLENKTSSSIAYPDWSQIDQYKADWEKGTKQNVDTTTSLDSVVLKKTGADIIESSQGDFSTGVLTNTMAGSSGSLDLITKSNPIFERNSSAMQESTAMISTNVPRYETGKVNQSLMIEEGTRNYLYNPSFEINSNGDGLADGWANYIGSGSATFQVVSGTDFEGSKSQRIVASGWGGDDARNQVHLRQTMTTFPSSGSPFTLSTYLYIKSLTNAKVQLYIDWYNDNSSTPHLRTDIVDINETTTSFKRYKLSGTVPANANRGVIYIILRSTGTNANGEIYADGAQFEGTSYPTTFTLNSREKENLKLPTGNVISRSQGTIGTWVYVNESLNNTKENRYIFATTTNLNSYANTIALRHVTSNKWTLWTSDGTGTSSTASVSDTLSYGWHYFTGRWTVNELALFIDGVKVTSVANPKLPSVLADTLFIGSWPDGKYGAISTKVDDLQVSIHARTDQEISNDYTNPQSKDGDTSYQLTFDKTLIAGANGERISNPITLSSSTIYPFISWNEIIPWGTSVKVETNLSLDGGITWNGWKTATKGNPIPDIIQSTNLSNARIKLRETLSTNNVTITPLLNDLKISPSYVSSGTWTSPVYQASLSVVNHGTLEWLSTVPSGSSLTMEYRTSGDNITWGAWTKVANGGAINYQGYIQYRATLAPTTNGQSTPVLKGTSLYYYPNNKPVDELDETGYNNPFTFVYDTNTSTTTVENPNGVVYKYKTDPFGNVISFTTDDHGKSTTNEYTYDCKFNVTEMKDGNGVHHYRYDSKGNLINEIRPNDDIVVNAYDDYNNLIQSTEPFEYVNNLLTETDAESLDMGLTLLDFPKDSQANVSFSPFSLGATWTIEAVIMGPLSPDSSLCTTTKSGWYENPVFVDSTGALGTVVLNSQSQWKKFYASQYNVKKLTPGIHRLTAVGNAGNTVFYIDGVYVGTSYAQCQSSLMSIGNDTGEQYGGSGFGKLSDFRVWNIARSSSQILGDMFSRLIGSEAGLVAYWKMDEGSGGTVTNIKSGNKFSLKGSPVWNKQGIGYSLDSITNTLDNVEVEKNTPSYIQDEQNKGISIGLRTVNKIGTEGNGANTDWNKWGNWGQRCYWSSETQTCDASLGAIYSGVNANSTMTFLYHYNSYTVQANKAYTLSVMLKSDVPRTCTVEAYINDDGNAGKRLTNGTNAKTISLSDQWKRFTFTITPGAQPIGKAGIGFAFDNLPVGAVIYAARPQFEENVVATPYTNTVSGTDLSIPTLDIINPVEGTIEGSFCLNSLPSNQYSPIFVTANVLNPNPRLLIMRDYKTNTLSVWDGDGNTEVKLAGKTVLQANTWYDFAYTWSPNGRYLYLNGIQEASNPITQRKSGLGGNARIGTWSVEYLNGKVGYLRISKKARSGAELATRSSSNDPLPVDPDTTYKLEFDNNLSALKWNLKNWYYTNYGSSTAKGSLDFSASYYGNQSFKIEKTNYDNSSYFQQSYKGKQNQKYTLSAWIKTENISESDGGAYLRIRSANGSWSGISSEFVTGTNDWRRVQVTFTIPSGTGTEDIQILLSLGSATGTVWFDGIQMVEGSGNTLYNLANNGSFENTGLTSSGWTLTSGSSFDNRPGNQYSGKNSLRITHDGKEHIQGATSQRFPVTPGDSLTISAFLKAVNFDPNQYQDIFVRFFGRDNVTLIRQDGPNVPGGSYDWVRVAKTVTVPDQAFFADVSIQVKNRDSGGQIKSKDYGNVWVDGIQLQFGSITATYTYDSGNNNTELVNETGDSIASQFDEFGNEIKRSLPIVSTNNLISNSSFEEIDGQKMPYKWKLITDSIPTGVTVGAEKNREGTSSDPRYTQDSFCHSIRIAEPTTNYLYDGSFEIGDSNKDGVSDGWARFSNSGSPAYQILTGPVFEGSRSQRVIASGMQASGNQTRINQEIKTIPSPGTAYTLSAYLKVPYLTNTKVCLYVDWYNSSSVNVGSSSFDIGQASNEFKRYQLNGTVPANATKAVVYVILWATGTGAGGEFIVDCVQLEGQPSATPFTNGIRSKGFVTIPTSSVLSTSKGTIESWVYVDESLKNTDENRYVFSQSTNSTTEANTLSLRHTKGNEWDLYSTDSSSNVSHTSVKDTLSTGWHYFAVSWTKGSIPLLNQTALYIDGVKVASVINAKLPSTLSNKMFIGCWVDETSGYVNTLIDDFRVSSIQRTDAEIKNNFYYKNNLLPTDVNTTYKLNHDGNLQYKTFEEGTTNLLYDPSFEIGDNNKDGVSDGWAKYVSSGTAEYKVVDDKEISVGKGQQIVATGLKATNDQTRINQEIPVSSSVGSKYTLSAYLKIPVLTNAKVQLYTDWYDSAYNNLGSDIKDILSPSNSFDRYELTGTVRTNAVKAKIYIIIRATGANASGTVVVDNVQFEGKKYSTPFTDGKRINNSIAVSTSDLSVNQGTIESWVYVDENIKNTLDNHYIFAMATNASAPYANVIALRHTTEGDWSFWTSDVNSNNSFAAFKDKLSYGWHYFAARWKTDESALFIDGEKVASVSKPYLPKTLAGNVYIGSWADGISRFANTQLDGLRVSSQPRSDYEIYEDFLMSDRQTLPVDANTTLKLNFDGNLRSNFAVAGEQTFKLSVSTNATVLENGLSTDYITCLPGKDYTLSAFMKGIGISAGAEQGAVLQIQFYNYQNVQIEEKQAQAFTGTFDWRKQILTFRAPEGAVKAKVQLLLLGTGTVWFDAAQLESGVTASSYNLIKNPGGEISTDSLISTDSIDGWKANIYDGTGEFTWDNQVAKYGVKSLKISSATGLDGDWSQQVAVKPNTTYTFTGWVKTENLKSINASVYGSFYLREFNSKDKLNSTVVHNDLENHTESDWRRVIYTFTTRPDTVELLIAASFGNWGKATGTVWFDGLRLVEGDMVTDYSYDDHNFLTSVTDPLGNTVNNQYDLVGNLLNRVDAKGYLTTYTYNLYHQVTSMKNAVGQTTYYTYDKNGNLVTEKDARGYSITYTYDSFDRLIQVSYPNGSKQIFNYDPLGNKVKAIDGNGNATRYQYDGLNKIIAVIDPYGISVKLGYDSFGNLTSTMDQDGNVTKYTYDILNRLTSVTDPENNVTSQTYDQKNNITSKTDANGTKTCYEYDFSGKLINVYDSITMSIPEFTFGGSTFGGWSFYIKKLMASYTYDDSGNRIMAVDAMGNATYYVYDALGHVTEQMDPLGNKTSLKYDRNGNLLSTFDPMGNRRDQYYDPLNRMIFSADAKGAMVRNTYDANGNVVASYDKEGYKTSYSYDSLNRLTTVSNTLKDNSVRTITTYYDANGNKTKVRDPLGYETIYTYDKNNRLLTITNPEKGITKFSYDNRGNLKTETDPIGNTSTYTYNKVNKVLTKTNSKGETISYQYDSVGNTTEVTDPKNNITKYTYDNFGRVLCIIDPMGYKTTNTYDRNGNLIAVLDGNNHKRLYSYDRLNRIETIKDENGKILNSYTYDCNGNRLSATDPYGAKTQYTYNELNQLIAVKDPLGYTTSYTYDLNGNQETVTDGRGNTSTFIYDELNRLKEFTDPLGNKTTTSYDLNNNVKSVIDPKGNETSYQYDRLNRVTFITNDGITQYQYDANGNVRYIIDPMGYKTEKIYDSNNRVEKIIDPLGKSTVFTYDANGNQATVTSPTGGKYIYEYDKNNRVTTVTDPLNYKASYTYDGVGNNKTYTDFRGNTTSYTYDYLDRLETVTEPLGGITTYIYDPGKNRKTAKDPLGNQTIYDYNGNNKLVSVTDANGNVTTYTYDGNGNTITSKDAKGYVTKYTYDKGDHLTTIIDPRGKVTKYTYDANGNKETITDANGFVTSYKYDKMNRLEYVIDAQLGVTQYIYDKNGNKTDVIDPLKQKSHYTYDKMNRVLTVTTPEGVQTTYTYDANGNKLTEKNTAGNTTVYTYDLRNMVSTVKDPLGNITSYTYDGNQNRLTVKDALSNITYYTYDKNNRLSTVKDSLGNLTSYGYDKNGNLTSITDPLLGKKLNTYDETNRLSTTTDQIGNTVEYEYDKNGNLWKYHDGNGSIIEYQYDELNRLTTKIYPDSTKVEFGYDNVGNVTSIKDITGTYAFQYDKLNRLTKETKPDLKVNSYHYDAAGNNDWKVLDGQQIDMTYDHDNRLKTVSKGGVTSVQYTYDNCGRLSTTTYADGLTTTNTYDAAENLQKLVTTNASGTVIESLSYTYDKVNRKTSEKDELTGNVTSYGYDAAGKLTKTIDESGTTTYSYDKNGNRISKTDGTGNVTTYTYNLANQLIKMGDPSGVITNYSYDKNGNLLTETVGTNVTSYGYNFDGKLVKITDPDGKVTTFVYDGEGQRISKTYAGVVTKFYYDGMSVAKEMNGSGTVLATYLYGLGGAPVTMNLNGQTYYYLFNGHGDTIVLANSTGTLVAGYGYDAFGKVTTKTGTVQNPFQYVGKHGYYYDGETGMHFIQIRYYDSEIGRFTSADTFSGLITKPISQNAYVYGNSDPVNHVDLDGHISLMGIVDKYIIQPVKKYVVDPIMKYVVQPIKQYVIDPVVNFGKSVYRNVQQGARYINNRYIQPAKKAVETEAEILRKRVVKAKEEVKNRVKASIDKAINDAKAKAEAAKKEVLEKLDAVGNATSEFLNSKTGKMVMSTLQTVGGAIEFGVGAAMTVGAGWTGIGAVAGIALMAYGANNMIEGGTSLYNQATNHGDTGLNILRDYVYKPVFGEKAGSIIYNVTDIALGFVGGGVGQAKNVGLLGKLVTKADALADKALDISKFAGSKFNEVKEFASTKFTEAAVYVSNKASEAVGYVSTKVDEAKGFISSKVDSFVQGAQSKWNTVKDINLISPSTVVVGNQMMFTKGVKVGDLFKFSTEGNSNKSGLNEFDIVPYGEFNKPANVGDGLSGHELLQNAWLEANGKATRGKGLSLDNPAIALYENPMHKYISAQQRSLGLNKKNLTGTSWRTNVLDNIEIMKRAGVPRDKIAELAWQTRKFSIENGF